MVLNQPAGHLDPGETLIEAAIRETHEETGWQVNITGVLNMNLYHSTINDITYHRTTFIGETISFDRSATLDEGIIQAHWLSLEELNTKKEMHRSPLVSLSIEQYLNDPHYPLSLINDYR